MLLSDYVNDVQEIVHDTTASVWPVARVVSRINQARLDAALDMHCVRQNVTGIQLMLGQEIYVLNGAVAGAIVTAGGSNYGAGSTVPVTFAAAPAGGVTATGVGNLVGGSLSSITLTQWGQGYTSVPAITIGGTGSGAAATAVPLFRSNPLSTTIGNPITVVGISYIWNGQRRSMKYLNFTLFQAYARMWTINFLAPPGVWTEHKPNVTNASIYIQPPPDQLYLAEFDVLYMPAPLVAMSDLDTDMLDPWDRAAQFRASEYLLMKLRNMGQVGAMGQLYDAKVPRIITTTGGYRIPNPYNRNFQRRVMR